MERWGNLKRECAGYLHLSFFWLNGLTSSRESTACSPKTAGACPLTLSLISTRQYLLYSIMMARYDSRFKRVALRLLSRVHAGTGLNPHDAASHYGRKSPNMVFNDIKKTCGMMSERLLRPALHCTASASFSGMPSPRVRLSPRSLLQ